VAVLVSLCGCFILWPFWFVAVLDVHRSVKPTVPNFRRKSFNVRFFPYLLENSFSCILTVNLLHSHGFYQTFMYKLNMVNFSMLIKDKAVVMCDMSQL